MAGSPTPGEKVDYVAEAAKRIDWANRTSVDREVEFDRHLREAQVHAQLAIAEQLRGIRESLGGFDAAQVQGALTAEIEHVGREILEIVWRANGGRS